MPALKSTFCSRGLVDVDLELEVDVQELIDPGQVTADNLLLLGQLDAASEQCDVEVDRGRGIAPPRPGRPMELAPHECARVRRAD
jgi:hypothetical protein